MGIFDCSFGKKSKRICPERLIGTFYNFANADSWAASRKIVEKHPELLTDDVASLLELFISNATEQKDSNSVQFFKGFREILRRCREIGMDKAFAENEAIQAPEMPDELQAILHELSEPSQQNRTICFIASNYYRMFSLYSFKM